jgi:hypothetical protein
MGQKERCRREMHKRRGEYQSTGGKEKPLPDKATKELLRACTAGGGVNPAARCFCGLSPGCLPLLLFGENSRGRSDSQVLCA